MKPIAAALFFAVGIALLYFGGRTAFQGLSSQYWPTVEGQVLSSAVKSECGRKGGTVYSPDVSYAYAVNGMSFTSNRVSFGSISTGKDIFPRLIVEKYPAGSQVTVHYSSSDPSHAVLEPGSQPGAWVAVVAGLVFGGVGVAALYLPTRYERLKRRLAQTAR